MADEVAKLESSEPSCDISGLARVGSPRWRRTISHIRFEHSEHVNTHKGLGRVGARDDRVLSLQGGRRSKPIGSRKEIAERSPGEVSQPPPPEMLFLVVQHVTPLAKRDEVAVFVVGGIVIPVCRRQNDAGLPRGHDHVLRR